MTCGSVGPGAVFLDMEVYQGPNFAASGKFSWCPHFKPTGQRVHLNGTSAHQPTTHASWPIAEVRRIHERSSCVRSFELARSHLVCTFKNAFMDPEIVSKAVNWKPPPPIRNLEDKPKILWIPVPYHPLCCARLGKALSSVCNKWKEAGIDTVPRFAFKKSAANLAETVKLTQGI